MSSDLDRVHRSPSSMCEGQRLFKHFPRRLRTPSPTLTTCLKPSRSDGAPIGTEAKARAGEEEFSPCQGVRMAETVVKLVINQLAQPLTEEVKLLGGVRKEIALIRDELDGMRAFLRDADQMQHSNEAVKAWLKQVRDLAYDLEDAMDEFLLRMDRPRRRRPELAVFIRRGIGFVFELRARYQISTRIQDIKIQLRAISERKERFSFGVSGGERRASSSSSLELRLMMPLLVEESELVGIERPKEDLIKRLVEGESELAVVGVVGMGGLGKTTIVRKIYENQRLRLHFQSYAWITVSQSYEIEALLRNMICEFLRACNEAALEGINSMNYVQLAQWLKSFLEEKRYVAFLDDVWSVSDWVKIKHALPENEFGSRIILTTRIHDVAQFCARPYRNYYALDFLSPEHSWTLFCNKVFGWRTSNGTCPSYLEEPSRDILKLCGGLPLSIVTVSGLLSTKNMTHKEWDRVYRSLGAEIEGNELLINIKKILWLSYDDLPHHLKSCFLYLSIYPEDCFIRKTTLMQKWMAEGMIESIIGLTLEEVSEIYVNELLRRSLIQVLPRHVDGTGNVYDFLVHDMIRELIVSKSREQNFVSLASNEVVLHDKVRRLSVHNGQSIPERLHYSHVRTLIIFAKIQTLQFSSFKMLKVLSLEFMPLESFPDGINNLFHLRYLSLRGTSIEVIPNSIRKLKCLQTLNLKRTRVFELPMGILKCQQLRHLVASKHVSGHVSGSVKIPTRIGSLTFLQKLCYIDLKGDVLQVTELGKLTQLRKLSIHNVRSEDAKDLCSSIKNMSHLQSLRVSSAASGSLLNAHVFLTLLPRLTSLSLIGTLWQLTPELIGSFVNISKIQLQDSRLSEDPFRVLQHLPNLLDLRLYRASYIGKELSCEVGGFSKLKLLMLTFISDLTYVGINKGAMPELVSLTIGGCQELCAVPTGIEHLLTLNVIVLHTMPTKFTDRIRKDEGEDWDKVKHIPDIIVF